MELTMQFKENILSDHKGPKQTYFSPYADNGGSIVAIAGEDYAVIASDTRLSAGFSIYTREQSKLYKLSQKSVLGCAGCWCDILTFTRLLEARMKMYENEHHKQMSTPAIAQLVTTMLYYKRFFPYYISNVLAGIDEEGRGCVYSYDPIGHCEKVQYRTGGSSSALLQPLLDNQIGLKNIQDATPVSIVKDRAIAIIKDVFISAAERDIYTGDGIVMHVITKDGITEEKFPLRTD
ncbi:proteasome subunit beta type-1-like [Limulus polyphemus]|uniref:Proteasome subunit beta type-1-like n=1 Tax=Limulus polyphemus TaxID=6850 RepID=A0ABM1BZN9_LIMPO|nr:proteasome subunit beta type-1-like [Limulus polyphemus]